MRDLIKRILREEYYQSDVDVDIMNYSGKDPEIQKMKEKLYYGNSISNSEIKKAEDFFKKEKEKEREVRGSSDETMLEKITDYRGYGNEQKSELKKLGQRVYDEIIKTNLSIFLSNIFNPESKIKIGVPQDSWFKENLKDLIKFYNDIKNYRNNFVNWTDGTKMTIEQKIIEIEIKLQNKDWVGIIENGDWSILNKINTNYTSWAKDITKRQLDGDLPMGGDMYIIKKYFEEKNVEEILPEKWLEVLRRIEKDKKIKIDKISFAQIDLISKFHEENRKILKDTKDTLEGTTNKGDISEENFFQLLKNKPENFNDIKRYDIRGSVVDTIFGVDGSFICDEGLKFVQVKSSKTDNAFIKRLQIPYFLVYPSKEKNNTHLFYYLSNNNPRESKNFNEDFVNVEKPITTQREKEKSAISKVLGQPGIGTPYFK